MNIDKKLDTLKQIKEVDAPSFLLTRIRESIQSLEKTTVPTTWKWAFAAVSVFVLALNLLLVSKTTFKQDEKTVVENLLTGMHISSSNQFYNE